MNVDPERIEPVRRHRAGGGARQRRRRAAPALARGARTRAVAGAAALRAGARGDARRGARRAGRRSHGAGGSGPFDRSRPARDTDGRPAGGAERCERNARRAHTERFAAGRSARTRRRALGCTACHDVGSARGPAPRVPAPRPIPAALPFELPDWPARSTQACLQGKRLSVVLRDAQIDMSQGPQLRERLRAQCEACGLELAELLINGVPVEPVAPIA